MFNKTTLPNGMRIITVPDKNSQAAAVLVLNGAGSKYETKNINGISHFLEHMLFKGTKKRPNTLKIAETLDRVGGAYNAFTSKEFTGYWAKVGSEHLDLALDWVSDIFLNSKIEAKQIKKEKGVIIEELNMYQDAPAQYIGYLWEELLYGDQPAGWKTIGQKQTILNLTRKHLLDYFKNHYSSLNTIICLAGNFDPRQIEKKIGKYFKNISKKSPKQKIAVNERQKKPKCLSYFKETDQSHLCLGVKGCNLFDQEHYSQQILATILGGNMSSRLFIKIREKLGLAYYIHTSSDLYTDTGYLATSAGVPHKDVKKVIKLILDEYQSIKQKKISKDELKKAKDYLKGSLTLNLESSDAKASFFAMQELLTENIMSVDEKLNAIDSVAQSDVHRTAQNIFQAQKLNLALIGPHKNGKTFKEMLKL